MLHFQSDFDIALIDQSAYTDLNTADASFAGLVQHFGSLLGCIQIEWNKTVLKLLPVSNYGCTAI